MRLECCDLIGPNLVGNILAVEGIASPLGPPSAGQYQLNRTSLRIGTVTRPTRNNSLYDDAARTDGDGTFRLLDLPHGNGYSAHPQILIDAVGLLGLSSFAGSSMSYVS
jgi:hypothetical protein